MQNKIPALQKNDLIYICAPAKAIEKEYVDFAEKFLIDNGYKVQIGKHTLGQHNYFSGTLQERSSDLQYGLDNPDVKAIICARGGYGCVQLLDYLQWASFVRNPKWIIGFSDVTFFHQKIQCLGIESIHATMPLNFMQNSKESFETLWQAVSQKEYSIPFESSSFNKKGKAEGNLVGGNLSILAALIGTPDMVKFEDTILFIEDLGEYLYHFDRIMYSFANSGIFDKISGLIVGGMTDMKDTPMPFGSIYEEIILRHLQFRNIPVAFNFPAGHIDDNRALRLGANCKLEVGEKCSLKFY